ncbi:hypothetical protein L1987_67350 [Smallanthus sonchifolius]|uniref:Uncharacterized protein n=1 Tax=Smallanthus sonchifolius TaxID=185202 RepID=A0ACB9B6Z6_9ASTR|nr:hypothetical protein L1987_67350 [Smallanthus sonchifolius]
MRNNICYKFLHLVFFILSRVLLCLKITTSTSLGHQPVVVEEDGNYKCIDKERHALLDFKAYIHQDPHGYLSTWTVEEEATSDCCKWFGVTCNYQTGRVTNLFLSEGELEGKISPSLLNLSFLSDLNLYGNSFNGTIPMFIGSMTQLRYLCLDWNDFTGPVPQELGNLTNLQVLSLRFLRSCTIENLDWLSHLSQLTELRMAGTSMGKANNWVNAISNLQKLSTLNLDGCDLSQVMHPYCYSCVNSSSSSSSSSIISLYLRNNNLNSSISNWLFPLTGNRLIELYLSGNKLDGIPRYLGNLCSLTYLYVKDNPVSFKFPDLLNNLSGCTSHALEYLDASGSRFTGSLSDDIQKFSSLQVLQLSNNQLNGTISEMVWQLPKLQHLDVSSNSLKGAISENIRNSTLWYINLSNNSIEASMSNLSKVEVIDLSSCKLGPHFPLWIQTLKNLKGLNMGNARISDTIPQEFWNTWPSQLTYLNLSLNKITGKVTDLLSNFDLEYPILDLSSNNFFGQIQNVSSTLKSVDLSKNKFYGGISFLCQIVDDSLSFLDLSNNLFSGQIPDCLWHFKKLKILNLGHNNLSGRLPASIDYLINPEVLILNNNNISGELPSTLKNCTKLTFLDLGANKFSGSVPIWIGEKFSELYALSLTSNNFFGTIPLQLCQLVNLQILDLSKNNLNGTIPSCLNNLTAMIQDGSSLNQNKHHLDMNLSGTSEYGEYVDHALINWQGSVREFGNTLGLVKSIDLSSNNLTGEIPYELTDLHELITLNLSMNSLLGEIPQKVGDMKKLLILDLSRNNLSGEIPSSMSHMTLLNYLDMSFNNLSGRIPSSTQLQTFVPSRYTGNVGLCGIPLSKLCPGDKEMEVPPLVGESEDDEEIIDDTKTWFYIGGAVGFAIGFWLVCYALLVNRRGRHAFFRFQDNLENWVYVKVVVFIAKPRKDAHP